MIDIDDLAVAFGTGPRAVHAVDGVSFRVARGESFGLVGESGSGKSTVLRALAGLIEQATGELRIDGQPLGLKRPRSFRKYVSGFYMIAFLDQQPSVYRQKVACPPRCVRKFECFSVLILDIGKDRRRSGDQLQLVPYGPAYCPISVKCVPPQFICIIFRVVW